MTEHYGSRRRAIPSAATCIDLSQVSNPPRDVPRITSITLHTTAGHSGVQESLEETLESIGDVLA